jgi:NADH-quinone oxidoreductase subunit M
VYLIEKQFKTRKISELGGLAANAPVLTMMLVIIVLANIALPLTNAFIGEFLMFTGIYTSHATNYNVVFVATAGLTVILGAVYMLNMVQKVFYGPANALTGQAKDLQASEKWLLSFIVLIILVFGIFPEPLIRLTQSSVDLLISKMFVKP